MSERSSDEKYCSSCGRIIREEAEICPHCGVRQKRSAAYKDKIAAGILGIALGGIGAHKFYLGKTGVGLLYLCFFWTGIPSIIGVIEGVLYLVATDEEFKEKYT